MNISQKAKKITEACRFCWMCRHICPIGNATGRERNTARARALSLTLVERGAVGFDDDIIDNVYECSLCGACTNDCATGYDPAKFTKEARTDAALGGKMPPYVEKALDSIENYGNVYGKEDFCDCIKNLAEAHREKTDTLFFIGKNAIYNTADKAVKAAKVLENAGVKFTVLADEPSSGYDMDFLLGATDETKQTMIKCSEVVSEFKKVICYDPDDAKIFLHEFKEYGIASDAETVTFASECASLLKRGSVKLKKTDNEYTFQDPASLARDLDDTESARIIIDACGNNKEMLLNRKDTVIAGHSIMNLYMKDVMKLVSDGRWENAENVGAKCVVTACPSDYAALSAEKPDGIELKTLEEIILDNTEE